MRLTKENVPFLQMERGRTINEKQIKMKRGQKRFGQERFSFYSNSALNCRHSFKEVFVDLRKGS